MKVGKYDYDEFCRKVKERHEWIDKVWDDFIGTNHPVTVTCVNGHVCSVDPKKLTRTDGLKGCPECFREQLKTQKDYEKNPKYCKFCGKKIELAGKYANTKAKEFCNSSCAASYNNTHRINKKDKYKIFCLNCGKEIVGKSKSRKRKFCCSKCDAEYRLKETIKRWEENPNSSEFLIGKQQRLSRVISNYLKRKAGNKCEKCGWGEINPYTGGVPLELHHKDGNYLNNAPENLEILCPNCHSLTGNYKHLNIGNGRESWQAYLNRRSKEKEEEYSKKYEELKGDKKENGE